MSLLICALSSTPRKDIAIFLFIKWILYKAFSRILEGTRLISILVSFPVAFLNFIQHVRSQLVISQLLSPFPNKLIGFQPHAFVAITAKDEPSFWLRHDHFFFLAFDLSSESTALAELSSSYIAGGEISVDTDGCGVVVLKRVDAGSSFVYRLAMCENWRGFCAGETFGSELNREMGTSIC
jgi:hypothetical protein